MSAATFYSAIAEHLATPAIGVYDEIQSTPTKPYYLVTVRHAPPGGRRLTYTADTRPLVAWVMAVNNNPAGLSLLVGRAIGLLDGRWLAGCMATVGFTGPVVDSDGPGDWRWAQGVEVRIHESQGVTNA